jgi:hypothetical protein
MTRSMRRAGAPATMPPNGTALRPSRRSMVRALACWGLVGMVPPIAGATAECEAAVPPAALGEIFNETAPLRLLGLLYLRDHAQDSDLRQLRRALFGGTSAQTAVEIAQTIATRRARDLAANDIAVVGGWLLTRGEAQLCAFVALTAAPP